MPPTGPLPVRQHRGRIAGSTFFAAALLFAAGCSSSESSSSGASSTVAPATSFRPTPVPDSELPAATQTKLRAALASTMATYDVPGAVVGVWVPGRGSWQSATGVANTTTKMKPTTAMVWPLRSITKSFAVTLVLQLVDDGKIDLDDHVDRYVTGVPNGDKVTVRELANMTSGLPDYTTEAFIDDFSADPARVFTIAQLNAYAFAEKPQFAPGTKHVYTNTNTNLLGSIVEKVTGRRFATVLRRRILDPMHLDSTAYLHSPDGWSSPHATGYQPDNGKLTEQPDNFSIFGPSGAMVSTLANQRVWAEALATGGLLSPETQAQRLQGAPLDAGPEYDEYALGIGEIAGWWGHTGEGFGFSALTMHDDSSGATVVIFMNIAQPEPEGHPPTALFRKIAAVLASS